MNVAIILRKTHNVNIFRDVMLHSISNNCNSNVLLCSGFFQELFGKQSYQATLEQNFANILATNNINLTNIGIHNNFWLPSFKNFHVNLCNANVNVKSYRIKGNKWHAKIFIIKFQEHPLLCIIGSSNITRPAFSDTIPFNYESDVILIPDSNYKKNITNILNEFNQNNDILFSKYSPEFNNGLSLEERISELEREILNQEKFEIV